MLTPDTTLQQRYQIVHRIGGGGMGTVYLATDNRLPGRRCAIKEMSPAALAPQDRVWSVEVFRQEAQLLAHLRHPGLTAVTDFFDEGGNWYLVMDYVEGGTLAACLAQMPGGRFPLREALRVMQQLCEVLSYLHSQPNQVIFRDLKPSNVICTPEGQIKLIDFGIARFFKPGKVQDTAFMGTPGYAAPEQYGGMGQSDPRTDIYSLGVLLMQMVTGHDPSAAVSPFPVPGPTTVMPTLPSGVANVIERATQMRPELRYATVAELQAALFTLPDRLTTAQHGTQVMPQPALPPSVSVVRAGLPSLGVWIGLGLAVMLLLLCGGAGILSISQGLIPLDLPGGSLIQGFALESDVSGTTAALVVQPTDTVAPTSQPASSASLSDVPITIAPSTSINPSTATLVPTPSSPPRPVQLAFVKGSVANTDVFVADADGGNQRCVACSACDEAEPSWSPDGRWIVYHSNCAGSYDIWVVGVDGGSSERLTHTDDLDEREPSWSPDGQQIVYRASPLNAGRNEDGDLYVMDYYEDHTYSLGIRGRAPVWSPDGRHLAFMSERDGSWQIYLYGLGDGGTRKITSCTANCRWPAWSPDGRSVIYHATTGPGSVTADTVWIMPLSGGEPISLLSGAHPGRPSWSAAGLIAMNSDNGIERVTEDGRDRRVLIDGQEHWAPTWSR